MVLLHDGVRESLGAVVILEHQGAHFALVLDPGALVRLLRVDGLRGRPRHEERRDPVGVDRIGRIRPVADQPARRQNHVALPRASHGEHRLTLGIEDERRPRVVHHQRSAAPERDRDSLELPAPLKRLRSPRLGEAGPEPLEQGQDGRLRARRVAEHEQRPSLLLDEGANVRDRFRGVRDARVPVRQNQQVDVREIETREAPPVADVLSDIGEVLPMESTVHVERELLGNVAHRVDSRRVFGGARERCAQTRGEEQDSQNDSQRIVSHVSSSHRPSEALNRSGWSPAEVPPCRPSRSARRGSSGSRTSSSTGSPDRRSRTSGPCTAPPRTRRPAASCRCGC